MNTTGLVRVTVSAPARRIDLALPERAPLAELLPALLAHAGEDLADRGAGAGGWVLRRADGTVLEPARSLGAQRVRDGEVLHLAQAHTDWPELEYDDLVDAIATGSSRLGASWGPRHTRATGLGLGVVGAGLALVAVLRAGPPFTGPALWALGAAVLLLAAGVLLARTAGDAGAGSVAALCALPFAFAGGGVLLADDRALTDLGSPHLLAASAALALASVVGLFGVVDRAAVFVGGTTAGVLGALGAWLATWDSLEPQEAAGVVAGLGLALSPLLAQLSLRLAGVPMPVLPRGAADLLRDDPQPPRAMVYAAVLRADSLLTGMLGGFAVVVACCEVVLVRSDSTAAVVLACLVAAGLLLRARLYPVVRQRSWVIGAGVFGAAAVLLGPVMAVRADLLGTTGPVLLAAGAGAAALGLVHSGRAPTPYLGRYAEVAEVLVLLAVVPVLCSVLGLYGHVRGLGG
ncbi:type VII secretion integral membrane protein EccD [Actinokineospora bangkokensis]|uniref:Type VII secretion integral membrane protein EccD n=1 Tax=Actinokineospora bangkokensis TaxID=1193682 RepID=A0A1Q9LSZ3_9PSEU|nr:type VII secretion integral membrane protein EccD [Actinokineospora bangkokensis]OLR95123.1 type VII secretion integral membrane protein EccD [Actinokineospora bangkokensis]